MGIILIVGQNCESYIVEDKAREPKNQYVYHTLGRIYSQEPQQ